jgi:hypothetical protein
MQQAIRKSLLLTLALGCFSAVAAAQTLTVGDLSFDQPTPGSVDQFDIFNYVGDGLAYNSSGGSVSATTFTIDVTSLVVDLEGGGTITIPGSDFTSVDSAGDLDCDAAACNLFGDEITGATLTGTFSETGLSGLDPGYTGIEDSFTTTIAASATSGCPSSTELTAGCDTAPITATETGAVSTPEPGTWTLLGLGLLGLFLVGRKRLRPTNANRAAVA